MVRRFEIEARTAILREGEGGENEENEVRKEEEEEEIGRVSASRAVVVRARDAVKDGWRRDGEQSVVVALKLRSPSPESGTIM